MQPRGMNEQMNTNFSQILMSKLVLCAKMLPFPLSVPGALQSDGHLHAQQSHARQQQPVERLLFDGHHTPHCHHAVDREQEATQQSQQGIHDATHHGAQKSCTEGQLYYISLCLVRQTQIQTATFCLKSCRSAACCSEPNIVLLWKKIQKCLRFDLFSKKI